MQGQKKILKKVDIEDIPIAPKLRGIRIKDMWGDLVQDNDFVQYFPDRYYHD